MKVTPEVLQQVYFENIREHQIGGETDGISEDVARDLGFAAASDVVELSKGLPQVETPRKLTSAQQNANARNYVKRHLERVQKQVIDPHYG